MLCVLILYICRGSYSLKSTLNDRFFEKLFIAILFTLRIFVRNRRRNTFHILFWRLAWGSNPGFTSNKPTHYLLDYGEFNNDNIYCLIILTGNFSSKMNKEIPLQSMAIVKGKFKKIFSSFFLKHFPTKKVYGGPFNNFLILFKPPFQYQQDIYFY